MQSFEGADSRYEVLPASGHDERAGLLKFRECLRAIEGNAIFPFPGPSVARSPIASRHILDAAS
jgi:hypothetical protein